MRLRFQKGDLLAIALVAVLAAVVFAFFLPRKDSSGALAEIYQNGKLITTVPLTSDREFTVIGNYCNSITVLDGKIAVTASDCPGEDCVRQGWVSSAGRSIVCLPNGLEIRILSDIDHVDFAVG